MRQRWEVKGTKLQNLAPIASRLLAYSLLEQLVLWTTIALGFGWLVERYLTRLSLHGLHHDAARPHR